MGPAMSAMSVEHILHSYDLALLQSAARFNLHLPNRKGRMASAKWLAGVYRKLLEATKPDAFWEIGAFSAQFSIDLRQVLPRCRRLAFEANPHNFQEFKDAAIAAGVNYQHLAIGNAVGECALNIPVGPDQSQHVNARSSALRKPNADYEQVTVPMSTVDDCCQRAGVTALRHAMWIDVEGFGCQVLEGAVNTLEKTDFVFIEVEDRVFWAEQKVSKDTKHFLFDAGFVPIARDFEYYHQYNLLFARQSVFAAAPVQQVLVEALSQQP